MEFDPALIGALAVIAVIALVLIRRWHERSGDPHAPSGDALAEADVYLAYGRKDDAIRILEEALQAEPQREDLSRKLGEIRAGR